MIRFAYKRIDCMLSARATAVSGAEQLTPAKLRQLLVEVDLEYLVDHPGALVCAGMMVPVLLL